MKYLVSWIEKHSLVVTAENEKEAIKKAQIYVDPLITESLYDVCNTSCVEQKS